MGRLGGSAGGAGTIAGAAGSAGWEGFAGRSGLAGRASFCVLLESGSVKCWGDNHYGQLGLGDTTPRGSEPGTMGDALPALELE